MDHAPTPTAPTSTALGAIGTPPPDPTPSLTPTPTAAPADFLESSPKDWNLPDDLKDYKSLEKFPKGIELVRAYKNLEKDYSARAPLKRPDATATPEQTAAFTEKLRELTGAPKTPEEYGLKAPENLPAGVQWNEDMAKGISALAHKHGWSPESLHEAVDFHNASLAKMQEGALQAQAQTMESAKAELQKAWGPDAQRNGDMALKMAETLGLEVDDSIGNNPKVVQALHRAAEMFNKINSEPGLLINGEQTAWADTAQTAFDKITNSDDFMGKNGPAKAEAAVETLKRLHASMKK